MHNLLHLLIFFLFCGGVTVSYYILNFILNRISPSYKKISPPHKKFYVRSNLIKGGLLGIWSPYAMNLLYTMSLYDTYDKHQLKILSALYASLDSVSLFMVPKMQLNTIIHHIAVLLLYLYCLYYDFNLVGLIRIIIVYAIWSTLAYPVNLLLALRVYISRKNYFVHLLCQWSFFKYLVCCILNWSYQIYSLYNFWLIDDFGVGCWTYSIVMGLIVYDDIVLMHYLRKRITSYKYIKNKENVKI